jgi:hypothetical protein
LNNSLQRASSAAAVAVARSPAKPSSLAAGCAWRIATDASERPLTITCICPYTKPLSRLVVEYIDNEGIEVKDYLALEIPDNLAVAAQDPVRLREIYGRLDLSNVDGLVLSACVQMQSLPSIDAVERESGVPTLSAAVTTTWQMLKQLKLRAEVPGCGALLSGRRWWGEKQPPSGLVNGSVQWTVNSAERSGL